MPQVFGISGICTEAGSEVFQLNIHKRPFSRQEKQPIFFDRLHEALLLLKEFFNADGKGIDGAKLYTDSFKRLDIQLSLNGVDQE